MGSNQSRTDIEQNVKNTIGLTSFNEIRNTCLSTFDAENRLRISGVSNSKIADVSQENIFKDSCELGAAIDAVQDAGADQELLTALNEAQDATGIFGFNSSTSKIVNNLNTDVQISVLNQTKNLCKSQFSGLNELSIEDISDGALVTDILQTNEQYNNCIQSGLAENEATAKAAQDVTEEVTKSQIAGVDPLAFLAIIGVFIIGIVLVLIFGGKTTSKVLTSPAFTIPLMLLIVGSSLLGVMAATKSGPFNPCKDINCKNGGVCDKETGTCNCESGFTGNFCEIPPDPCANINCLNGGTCADGTCNCLPGFTGPFCETPVADTEESKSSNMNEMNQQINGTI